MQYTCGVVEGLSYHLHVRRPWCFLPTYAPHSCFTVYACEGEGHAMGRVRRSKGHYTKLALFFCLHLYSGNGTQVPRLSHLTVPDIPLFALITDRQINRQTDDRQIDRYK